MTTPYLAAFVAATVLLYLTPGPAMMLVMQTTARHGRRAAFVTVAALNVGEAILVFTAAVGLAAAAQFAEPLLTTAAWCGVFYLVWRAATAWRHFLGASAKADDAAPRESSRPVLCGFAVAFSNPATLIFFTALLPQFVSPGPNMAHQLLMLAGLYIATVAILDIVLVLTVSRFAGGARVRMPRPVGVLCNALALTVISAFALTHIVGATTITPARATEEIVAKR